MPGALNGADAKVIAPPTGAGTRPDAATGVLLIRTAVTAFLLLQAARTWADPDLWGHVRFGADILASGLPTLDPYSFTSDIAWVNHEWLAELVMYAAWAGAAGAGLVALKLAILVAVMALVTAVLRSDRVAAIPRDLMLFAVLAGLWARVYVVRPQLFSLLLFAALLWVLRRVEQGHSRLLWVLPAIFAGWVNLHGGWIVGMGTLGIWIALNLTRFSVVRMPPARVLGAAMLSLAGTLLNPYGIEMWRFLAETVQLERPNISDWRPLFESGPSVIVPWTITAAMAGFAIARRRPSIPYPHVAIVVALAVGSIRVNRIDAFFTLATVMLLGRQIAGTRDEGATTATASRTKRPQVVMAALLAVFAIVALLHPRSPVSCVRLDGPWMPEREAGAFIARNQLKGRLLAWFGWGQYAIWHFAPDLKVSLDGRRETVYSDAFVARHVRLYFEPQTESDFLKTLAPDYAWLPADLPLVTVLEQTGWRRVFSGPRSVVLVPRTLGDLQNAAVNTPACFPGP